MDSSRSVPQTGFRYPSFIWHQVRKASQGQNDEVNLALTYNFNADFYKIDRERHSRLFGKECWLCGAWGAEERLQPFQRSF